MAEKEIVRVGKLTGATEKPGVPLPTVVEGCGRFDLPGSYPDQMYESLRRLASLPDDTVLLPGHNYSSVGTATMGEMKSKNVSLCIPDLESRRRFMGDG